MTPQTGNPKTDGRYVVFCRCKAMSARDWVEPILLAWSNGAWVSSFVNLSGIIGWIGPLPVLKVDEIQKPAAIEYDL